MKCQFLVGAERKSEMGVSQWHAKSVPFARRLGFVVPTRHASAVRRSYGTRLNLLCGAFGAVSRVACLVAGPEDMESRVLVAAAAQSAIVR